MLASSILGVDEDIRMIADEFAEHGYIAAAPDLFWRSIPGPLSRGSAEAGQRSQPRKAKIGVGEADLVDTLAFLATLPEFNGAAAAMGFCYGGPYALIGPKRLGYLAGVSCHGSDMLDHIQELDGTRKPIRLLWGDQDNHASNEVLAACRAIAGSAKNVELHVFPAVRHGYMMRSNEAAFAGFARGASMACTLKVLTGLRSERARNS